MNRQQVIIALRDLRWRVEQEAETPIQEIECTMLTALDDVCHALRLNDYETRRVVGDAVDLLGKTETKPLYVALPLFDLKAHRTGGRPA